MQGHQWSVFSDEGLEKIQERIENLRVDLGASGVLLLDESGQLLAECGRLRGFDLNTFLALLGNAMSATNAVVHLLKDDTAFDLHYHEGQNYEMYTTRLTDQVFLMVMLERGTGTTSRIGMMWLNLRRAVTELRALLKKSMIETGTAASREIKSAVSDALDEALTMLNGDLLAPAPAPPAKPAPRPRKKLPGREKHSALSSEPPPSSEPPALPISPEILNDPNHILTYEQARALGLINLDESEEEV